MLFSSFVFIWIFLPIILISNYIAQKVAGNKAANVVLLAGSLFFYAWGEPVYILLMLASILGNWLFGLGLSLMDGRENARRILLAASVAMNIIVLAYYKYAGMIVMTFNHLSGTHFEQPNIPMPIGISFFTFQTMSYVIDVFRHECDAQKDLLKLALYVSLFPQLIAGPIVKYKDVAEQIDHRTMTVAQTAEGVERFIWGFGKKVLIANTLALTVDRIYALPVEEITSSMAWVASFFYTFQIYYDFSGYSDMAIGLGKMLGFSFKENFQYPYLSCSNKEFWRRWHISLGSWFRDYVYIPLGGNRKNSFRTKCNVMTVFLLTGLWHGASWNYVVWGAAHGICQLIEKRGSDSKPRKKNLISWIVTFLTVHFLWVLFRIENIHDALRVMKRLLFPWLYRNGSWALQEFVSPKSLVVFVIAVVGMGVIPVFCRKKEQKQKTLHAVLKMAVGVFIMFLSFCSLAANTYNPFIYFRF